MRGWRRWLLLALAALLVLVAVGYGVLAASTSRSQLARAIVWGESDVDDHRRFPARRVAAGPDRFDFRRPPGGGQDSPAAVRRIGVWDGLRLVERDLEQFLAASQTTAFLIVKGDTLLYEGYFNGAGPHSVQTSMSIAKSVLGALVGIAVGEGSIASVDDPITRYLPALAERDPRFGQITLRHLLTNRVFTETASGARADRPTLIQLLDQLRPGDTLVVWKLDRLGRSLRHLVDTVTGLAERGIGFRSLQEAIDTTTPGGKLVFHVFAALAEFERDLIRERTTAGLAAARARGRRGGRPSVMTAHKAQVAQEMYHSGQYTVATIAKTLGVSRASIYRHLVSPGH
jgi:DNA invertase Pin-like site-specific DNA recombinase